MINAKISLQTRSISTPKITTNKLRREDLATTLKIEASPVTARNSTATISMDLTTKKSFHSFGQQTMRLRSHNFDSQMRNIKTSYSGTCFKINPQSVQSSLQQPINYLTLVRQNCSKADAIKFSSRRHCRFDTSKQLSGPSGQHLMKRHVEKNREVVVNGWLLSEPKYQNWFNDLDRERDDLKDYIALKQLFESYEKKMIDQTGDDPEEVMGKVAYTNSLKAKLEQTQQRRLLELNVNYSTMSAGEMMARLQRRNKTYMPKASLMTSPKLDEDFEEQVSFFEGSICETDDVEALPKATYDIADLKPGKAASEYETKVKKEGNTTGKTHTVQKVKSACLISLHTDSTQASALKKPRTERTTEISDRILYRTVTVFPKHIGLTSPPEPELPKTRSLCKRNTLPQESASHRPASKLSKPSREETPKGLLKSEDFARSLYLSRQQTFLKLGEKRDQHIQRSQKTKQTHSILKEELAEDRYKETVQKIERANSIRQELLHMKAISTRRRELLSAKGREVAD